MSTEKGNDEDGGKRKSTGKKGSKFSNFQSRDYDMEDLERRLVEKGE